MADLSVTATPEPDSSPPRVRIDVTDTGNSPAISSVTVVRVMDGVETAVRSNDGAPLQLVPSGSETRTATIYDPEPWYGREVMYSTLQQPENTSGTVVLDSAVPWLVHLGLPNLSQPIDLRKGSFASRVRAHRRAVLYPLGRDDAVVDTDGRRKSPESSFTVRTETPEQYDGLLSLIDDAGVLLLNVPPGLGLLLEPAYISIGDVDEVRVSDIGEDPQRDWVMPYVTTSMPTGGTPTGGSTDPGGPPSWTWADVMSRYESWQDVMDDNATWADLMDPTS